MQKIANKQQQKPPMWRRYGKWSFCFFLVKGLAWLSPMMLTRLVG